MRGVEIGQSTSGTLRGNQPEEPEDGNPVLRVGTLYAAADHLSEPFKPRERWN